MTALCRATQSGALRSNMPCTAFVVVHGAVWLSFRDMGVWVRFLTSPVVLKEGRPANSADGTWFFGAQTQGLSLSNTLFFSSSSLLSGLPSWGMPRSGRGHRRMLVAQNSMHDFWAESIGH